MLARSYQGNWAWIAFGLISLFLLSQVLSDVKAKHRAGFPVDARGVIGLVLVFLIFAGLALFQVLTHPW
jgi:hypothetical protein